MAHVWVSEYSVIESLGFMCVPGSNPGGQLALPKARFFICWALSPALLNYFFPIEIYSNVERHCLGI